MNLNKFHKINNLFLKELVTRCILKQKGYNEIMRKEFDLDSTGENNYLKDRQRRIRQLEKIGVKVRNYGRSLYINRISPGCLVCPHWYKNGYMADITQSCNRKCFFCFRDAKWEKEPFSQLENRIINLYKGSKRAAFSIGNSEPLLAPDKVFKCLNLVNRLTRNKCYTFLYTNGDFLTVDILKRLNKNNLREIRISIKSGEDNFRPIMLAKRLVPNVLVEIPVLPDDENNMKRLLLGLNRQDIFGINFCELTCTRENKQNLKAKGYRLISGEFKPFYECFEPYEVPIYGSEETSFNLLEFAIKKNLSLGVHYCSCDNFRSTLRNERLHQARKNRKPYEIITKYGLIKKLIVYFPDFWQAYKDLKRNGIHEKEINILKEKNRLETHVRYLAVLDKSKYDIAILYSEPEGQEVDVKIFKSSNPTKKEGLYKDEERKKLELKFLMNIGRLLILEGKHKEAYLFAKRALNLWPKKDKEKLYLYLIQNYKKNMGNRL